MEKSPIFTTFIFLIKQREGLIKISCSILFFPGYLKTIQVKLLTYKHPISIETLLNLWETVGEVIGQINLQKDLMEWTPMEKYHLFIMAAIFLALQLFFSFLLGIKINLNNTINKTNSKKKKIMKNSFYYTLIIIK